MGLELLELRSTKSGIEKLRIPLVASVGLDNSLLEVLSREGTLIRLIERSHSGVLKRHGTWVGRDHRAAMLRWAGQDVCKVHAIAAII